MFHDRCSIILRDAVFLFSGKLFNSSQYQIDTLFSIIQHHKDVIFPMVLPDDTFLSYYKKKQVKSYFPLDLFFSSSTSNTDTLLYFTTLSSYRHSLTGLRNLIKAISPGYQRRILGPQVPVRQQRRTDSFLCPVQR